MSKKIAFELDENQIMMLELAYEKQKEKYASFDEYFADFERYINLSMKKFVLECEIKEVDTEIKELEGFV